MLNLDSINFSYKQNEVIKDLNLHLNENEIHGIVGQNGSGKTTLLNIIYGILNPKSGSVSFKNEPIRKEQISFLETKNFFYSRITGQEYLQLFKAKNPRFDIEEWNKLFHLPLDHFIDTYSTGMKKKLAFMAVLSLNSEILILDEPFNGLDLESNETLKSILRILNERNKLIIITSHIMDTLTTLCDKIHFLKDGKIENSFRKEEYGRIEELINKHGEADLTELIDSL